MTTKVTLRKKSISKKRFSLYLDFYPAVIHPNTGELTRREFLGLYIFDKPKNQFDKLHNTETIQIAEQIRQKRDNNFNKPEIYSGFEKEQLRIKELGEQNFVEYFKKICNKHKGLKSDNWGTTYQYLNAFTQGKLRFSDLNETFCTDFKEHLLTTTSIRSDKKTLSQNTADSYFNKLKASLKQAFKDGFLHEDLNQKIESIGMLETRRNFLTIEELNTLIKTNCRNPKLKRAALFSALTGLRYSDITKMVWSEIEFIKGEGYFINFTQQKTHGIERLPISKQAYDLLGEPKEPREKIFEDLKYSSYLNKSLALWLELAGIQKKITFHCFRHTYATLQLNNGTDIYTVSKMLGHRKIGTTQIYAKVIDKTKREATNKIKLDF